MPCPSVPRPSPSYTYLLMGSVMPCPSVPWPSPSFIYLLIDGLGDALPLRSKTFTFLPLLTYWWARWCPATLFQDLHLPSSTYLLTGSVMPCPSVPRPSSTYLLTTSVMSCPPVPRPSSTYLLTGSVIPCPSIPRPSPSFLYLLIDWLGDALPLRSKTFTFLPAEFLQHLKPEVLTRQFELFVLGVVRFSPLFQGLQHTVFTYFLNQHHGWQPDLLTRSFNHQVSINQTNTL